MHAYSVVRLLSSPSSTPYAWIPTILAELLYEWLLHAVPTDDVITCLIDKLDGTRVSKPSKENPEITKDPTNIRRQSGPKSKRAEV